VWRLLAFDQTLTLQFRSNKRVRSVEDQAPAQLVPYLVELHRQPIDFPVKWIFP
jgi:hypothetical protein